MRRTVAALILLALASAVAAGDAPEAPTPAEQYTALVKGHREAMGAFAKVYAKARTNAEREKAVRDHPVERFAYRFLELAARHPKDAAAVDALVWVVNNIGPPSDVSKGNPRAQALGLLRTEHVKSRRLAPLCEPLSRAWFEKDSWDALQAILAKSPHADVKAAACLALATTLQNRARIAKFFKERPGLAKQYEKTMGQGAVEEIEKKGEEGMKKEALKYLERVVKDFPDARDAKGKPLAREARSKLGAILHPVAVGKAAPEVEGEDGDGKAFKLSDCKGKVVLLVFWGGWCGPSRAMLPSLGALGKKLEGRPFALVGVSSDRDKADLKRALAREKIAWRSFWDGGSTQGPIATRWAVQGWPTIYLLDHEGVIRKKYLGNPGDAVLQEEVARLLKGAGPT